MSRLHISLIYHCSPLTLITNFNLFYLPTITWILILFFISLGQPLWPKILRTLSAYLQQSPIWPCLIWPLYKQFSMMQHKSSFQDPYMIMWLSFSPSMTSSACRIIHSSPAFSLTSHPLCSSHTSFFSPFNAFARAFPSTWNHLPSLTPISSI